MGIRDKMLAGGCALHVEAIHGETILVLSGLDAGKTFTAVRENDQDLALNTELGEDLRAKRMLRFRDGAPLPRLAQNDTVQTEDGKQWNAVRNPQDGYLSTDFELKEIVPTKDT